MRFFNITIRNASVDILYKTMNNFRFCHKKRRYVDKITKLWKQEKWSEDCKKRRIFGEKSHEIVNVTAYFLLDRAKLEFERLHVASVRYGFTREKSYAVALQAFVWELDARFDGEKL